MAFTRDKLVKKALGITLGFAVTTAVIRYLYDDTINWIAIVISSLIFGGLMTWALYNKETKVK